MTSATSPATTVTGGRCSSRLQAGSGPATPDAVNGLRYLDYQRNAAAQ
jgi:hypothetical protein